MLWGGKFFKFLAGKFPTTFLSARFKKVIISNDIIVGGFIDSLEIFL
jgi:hypothetical protein